MTFACNGTTPAVTGMWKTPQGICGPATPIGPTDSVRFVTNDFMYTGGDGYTVFTQGTDVQQPGDDLLQVSIDYVTRPLAGRTGGGGPDHRSLTGPDRRSSRPGPGHVPGLGDSRR